ncbi:MAG: serine/threonine protein kinase [Polyangiaceae bacterium]|nr:serine/threonine protein kinase [Polyangiaceae bacterium]
MSLSAGDRVADDLELLRPLGRGGMGMLWIARDLGMQREVVVKFVSDEVGAEHSEEALHRFEREDRAIQRATSPYVVQVYGSGLTADGLPYIVMEYLDGESLADRIDHGGPMGLPEVAEIVSQVAKGLSVAHERGIVHRDVKPDNVFLVRSQGELRVKLIDFGVAKVTGGGSFVTKAGAMIGTIAYMSPEALRDSSSVDHRSDLWALGVVAYEMVTRHLPFYRKNDYEHCLAIMRGKFVMASALVAGLPPALDAWFARALAVKPEGRFSSARELAAELQAAVNPTSVAVIRQRLVAFTRSTWAGGAQPWDPVALTRHLAGSTPPYPEIWRPEHLGTASELIADAMRAGLDRTSIVKAIVWGFATQADPG